MNEEDLSLVKTLISQELLYRPQIPTYFDSSQIDAAVRNFLLSRLQIHAYISRDTMYQTLVITPYIDGTSGYSYTCPLPLGEDVSLDELLTVKEQVKNLTKVVEFLGAAE